MDFRINAQIIFRGFGVLGFWGDVYKRQVYHSSSLSIKDSSFLDLESTSLSSGILTSKYSSSVDIYNATFQNNSAIKAGLFLIWDGGNVKCTDGTLRNNFAVYDSIVDAEANGRFEFYNSEISLNGAVQNPIGEIQASGQSSIIDNSDIHDNAVITLEKLEEELQNGVTLGFLRENFRNALSSILQSSLKPSNAAIQSIFGAIEIRNSSKIYNQHSLISSFSTELKILDSEIRAVSYTHLPKTPKPQNPKNQIRYRIRKWY